MRQTLPIKAKIYENSTQFSPFAEEQVIKQCLSKFTEKKVTTLYKSIISSSRICDTSMESVV